MDSIDTMKVTEAEAERFKNLSRSELLMLPDILKMKYLFAYNVKHIKLEKVAIDIMSLLKPFSGTSILFLIGATHVGKTTLAKLMIKTLIEKILTENDNDPSAVPYIFIPAPANGIKSISWTSIYENILKAGHEILINKKHAKVVENGTITIKPARFASLPALRDSLEEMIEKRKVMVLAIDEAYHLLRFGNLPAVMDTLKSLVDNKGAKLFLIGSYNLLELASNYGQVSSRAEIIHFERYHTDNEKDVAEFFTIVKKIQLNWPCEEVPTFSAISKELMEASLGCVGLLKKIMLRALEMQLANKGKWNPMFLSKVAKSQKLLQSIRTEITDGEENIKGAAYGETIFSESILEDAIEKMNGATSNG